MATVKVEIEIQDAPEIGKAGEDIYQLAQDAIAARHKRPDTVPDPDNEGEEIANPETKEEFLFRKTIDFWRNEIAAYTRDQATATAMVGAGQSNEALREHVIDKKRVKLTKV